MPTSPRIVACATLALALALACRDGGERRGAPTGEAAAARRYTVRGEVVQIAAPGAPPSLSIRHEAIPDFADDRGVTIGMSPMVMPFPVAEGVSLAGLAPGDKVRFRFAMDWGRNRMEIEQIEELPAETALEFGPR